MPLATRLSSAPAVSMGLLDDNEELLDKIAAPAAGFQYDPSQPSHTKLERDSQGMPLLARFTYVDEDTCIGCTHCALVARNTFLMEDGLGKARVYQQAGDSDELIAEAIDTCPVNCIHYVSYEDLETLELERLQRQDDVNINNYGDFKRAWIGSSSPPPPTRAQFYNNPAMGVRCDNCPGRGCKKCPMFGVGENPVYLDRLAKLMAKREASGEAKAARELEDRSKLVDEIVSSDYAVDADIDVAESKVDSALNELFASDWESDASDETDMPAYFDVVDDLFEEVDSIEDVDDVMRDMSKGDPII